MDKLQKVILGSHTARQSATTALQGSATINDSLPSASAANSAGASTNLAEISANLDPVIQALDKDERLNVEQENVSRRLKEACERYAESRTPSDLADWTCDDEKTRALLVLAADCSEAVYKRKTQFQAAGITRDTDSYEILKEVPAAIDGSIKATVVQVDLSSRTLVVAVRGTIATAPIDWVNNANGKPIEAGPFLLGSAKTLVHRGFLYPAEKMKDGIQETVLAHRDTIKQVLFTGHSAGGAIATLLFAHFELAEAFGPITSHCITFAAPPVIDLAPKEAELLTRRSIFLSFVMHGDPVPRAERSYIKALINVYANPKASTASSPLVFDKPELPNSGTVLLLYDRAQDEDEEDIRIADVTSQIQDMLFGNVKAHKMKQYLTLLSIWLKRHSEK